MSEEYIFENPVAQPALTKIVIGNRGRVNYNTTERVWSVGLDGVYDNDSTQFLANVEISQDEAYAALAAVTIPATWREALLTFMGAVKGLAIQKAVT